MITDYRQTPKQKSVDICIDNLMCFVNGSNKIDMVEHQRSKIHRRINKFQEMYNDRSRWKRIFPSYRTHIAQILDRIEYWKEEEENISDVVEDMHDTNLNNIRYMPNVTNIQAEIKRHPDFSPIFYRDMY